MKLICRTDCAIKAGHDWPSAGHDGPPAGYNGPPPGYDGPSKFLDGPGRFDDAYQQPFSLSHPNATSRGPMDHYGRRLPYSPQNQDSIPNTSGSSDSYP